MRLELSLSGRLGMCGAALLGAGVLAAASSGGAGFVVPIDETRSEAGLSVAVGGFSDSNSVPMGGSATISLDDNVSPGFIEVSAFSFALTEDLNLSLGGGIVGSLTITVSGLEVFDALGGGSVVGAIVDEQFALVGVPSVLAGTLSYSASGLFCVLIEGAGLACDASVDLADLGVVALLFAGDIAVSGGVATLAADVEGSVPLDPSNPDLGTVSVFATAVGSAPVPMVVDCPPDLNGDGSVDSLDLGLLLGAFGADSAGDVNGDGTTDSLDLGILLGAFGTACE